MFTLSSQRWGAVVGAPGSTRVILAERYEVGPRIGVGGGGVVYQGRVLFDLGGCGRLEQDCAIKIMHASQLGDSQAVRRFVDEGKHGYQVATHANLIATRHIGITPDGQLYLVMDLAGRTVEELAEFLRGEQTTIRAIADAVLAALDHLHRHGLVHGDLSAGNVYLCADGTVKVGDLGRSAVLPPAGSTQGGYARDLYRLGLLICALLGYRPMVRALPRTREPVPAGLMAEDLRALINRALYVERDSSESPLHARDLRVLLRSAHAGIASAEEIAAWLAQVPVDGALDGALAALPEKQPERPAFAVDDAVTETSARFDGTPAFGHERSRTAFASIAVLAGLIGVLLGGVLVYFLVRTQVRTVPGAERPSPPARSSVAPPATSAPAPPVYTVEGDEQAPVMNDMRAEKRAVSERETVAPTSRRGYSVERNAINPSLQPRKKGFTQSRDEIEFDLRNGNSTGIGVRVERGVWEDEGTLLVFCFLDNNSTSSYHLTYVQLLDQQRKPIPLSIDSVSLAVPNRSEDANVVPPGYVGMVQLRIVQAAMWSEQALTLTLSERDGARPVVIQGLTWR